MPLTFVSSVSTGDELAVATIVWAARWKTRSTPYSFKTLSADCGSSRSIVASSHRSARPIRSKWDPSATLRRGTTTVAPSDRSRSVSQLPMNPFAPVTSVVAPGRDSALMNP